ncbi:MAG: exosortase/archaeosortase family protein [Planctomycetaceae bacterium]
MPPASRYPVIALILLATAHLPFVTLQCQRLWSLEYYQFFPFAFGAFAFLFRQRMLRGVVRWDLLCTLLVILDLLLLAGGIWKTSPLAVYSGALLLCLAVCRACVDAEYECSLSYLFLLPLITLRPPLLYDEKVIHWLQSVTTRVGSLLLNHAGFLHLREGNILQFPGKRFLVEEACSGVQSLFTVLFLACLIICGYRRRWLHAAVVLASGFAVAGLMNVLRICAISVAWSEFQWDLSIGWQHDALGYAALATAAGLVLSADALMEFFFESVPDTRGSGVSFLFRNPFIVFWNRIFRLRRRTATLQSAAPAVAGYSSLLLTAAAVVCVCSVTLQLMAL